MKIYKILALVFALLALCAAGAGVYLALENIGAAPVLVRVPEAAARQALEMLDALCQGDYAGVSARLYGQPELGLDREPGDAVGKLFWDALESSRGYTVLRDCYATDDGIAMDVALESLDLNSITGSLRGRAQALLEQRVAQAEDTSEIYQEGGEYREDFVMGVLEDAARETLEQDGTAARWELTLHFIYEDGHWWIRPDEALLTAMSGGTTK